MKLRDWLGVGLAVATVACALPQNVRLVRRGVRLATSWRDGFRGTGEYVDAARRMAAWAQESGKTVAYCCSRGNDLLPVGRSRVLAMSWAAAPQPVKFGAVSELTETDAIVAPSDSSQAAVELPTRGYRVLDSGGGLYLWARGTDWLPSSIQSPPRPWRGECVPTLALGLVVVVFVAIGGFEGLVWGLLALSVSMFLSVAGLHWVDWASAIVCIVIALGFVAWLSSSAKGIRNQKFCLGVAACFFTATGALALTHTFVAPNGLGTVGGKARLLLLSAGLPTGFFTDGAFAPYQPTYPPGAAMLVLWGYSLANVSGEWLIQLVPCLWMSMLLGFLLTRASAWPERLLVTAVFLTPLTVRLAILFYPESLVGLCVLVGWERIRHDSLDWFGWLVLGAAGWFKNEGLIYFGSLALAVLLLSPSDSRIRLLPRLVCGALLPVAWQCGCRLAGASLDGYVPLGQLCMAKGLAAFARMTRYALLEPWRYGFTFPVGVAFLVRRSRRKAPALWMTCLGVVFMLGCFGTIFALSGAVDFDWHLDSMERLLWVPALLLVREIVDAL